MTEFKGTKGNWSVIKFNRYYNVVSDIRGGEVLAKFIADTDNEEQVANALLISKAPEMLEMLIDFLETYESGGVINNEYYIDKFKQLIKEATEL